MDDAQPALQHDTVNLTAAESPDASAIPPSDMTDWTPDLTTSDKPRYLAIADLIAADVKSGQLAAGDRLPPQRKLAQRLSVDFTTVARGYVEAQKRGLVESRIGQGTFVPAPAKSALSAVSASRPRVAPVDLSMNLPPEPDDPELIERMQAGLEMVGRDLVSLLRYQGFGGTPPDKEAASVWLGRRALVPAQDRIFITPGAHPALHGILGTLAKPGNVVLSENITYPGPVRSPSSSASSMSGSPWTTKGSRRRRSPPPASIFRRRRSISTRLCRIRRL
jgi:DNA-binding transcriptional MocR family regulator